MSTASADLRKIAQNEAARQLGEIDWWVISEAHTNLTSEEVQIVYELVGDSTITLPDRHLPDED